MRVRLNRKYANRIDDVDLSGRRVGEILDLPERDAVLLIAEGWASLVDISGRRKSASTIRSHASERQRPKRPTKS